MTYALRVDGNQQAVIEALRAIGATVDIIGKPVDLLVGFRGRLIALEVKQPKGKLTPAQKQWFATQRGEAYIVRDAQDAIAVVTRGEKQS